MLVRVFFADAGREGAAAEEITRYVGDKMNDVEIRFANGKRVLYSDLWDGRVLPAEELAKLLREGQRRQDPVARRGS
jgi:hypothetical protein